ncbi:small histone ubiquitination factor Shf1 [Schizosaccharomyces cryophilus OY26]|uniref:Small histone ubiquitination factor Shf1 n=1 Tax=Schizosaccharomyces cryophilus (strain OY26 / ATCC MYA-4695 / CBS 11777 / NBRC 106824 / NRRL Y48691) TaxID=653667 RepID=S9VR01_SCHCR|nr:small histone ubiquitination factor Shf1 [Schizosaccharomyces cryophilus OY26]EPY50358.1 small histone ubiquitination factor Shf1 [Schizosaccharomyces cryophilus OY26]
MSRRDDYRYEKNDHYHHRLVNEKSGSIHESGSRTYHPNNPRSRPSYESRFPSSNSRDSNHHYHYYPSKFSSGNRFNDPDVHTRASDEQQTPLIKLPDAGLANQLKSTKKAWQDTSKNVSNFEHEYLQQKYFWEKVRPDVFREQLRSNTAEKSLDDFVNSVNI